MQNPKTLNRALQRFVIDPRWIPFSSPLRDHNITSQCSQANCNSCTRRARCGVQRAMLATRADTTRSFCIARRFHLPPPSFQGCIERQRERKAISEPESTVKAHVEQARAAFTRLRCKLKLKWMPSKRHCLGKIKKKNKKNEIALTRVDRLRPASYVCSSSLGTTSVEFYLTFCPVLNFEKW